MGRLVSLPKLRAAIRHMAAAVGEGMLSFVFVRDFNHPGFFQQILQNSFIWCRNSATPVKKKAGQAIAVNLIL